MTFLKNEKEKTDSLWGPVSLLLAGDYALNGFRLGVFASHHNIQNYVAENTPLIADRTPLYEIGYIIFPPVYPFGKHTVMARKHNRRSFSAPVILHEFYSAT